MIGALAKQKRGDHVIFIVTLIICFFGFFFPDVIFVRYLIGAGLSLSILHFLYKSIRYRNPPLLLFTIFILPYCLSPVSYLFGLNDYIVLVWRDAESLPIVLLTSTCLLSFIAIISRFVQFNIPDNYRKKEGLIINIKSKILFFLCIIISAICIIWGASGNNMFASGGYNEDMGTRSTIFEYGIIFILLSFIYSRNDKDRFLVYVVCIAFVIKDLSYAGRVSSIMLALGVYVINFINRFSFKQVIFLVVVGYLFMQLWGGYRGALDGGDVKISKDENADLIFYASMRLHFLISIGDLPFEIRILSLLFFIGSIFFVSYLLPPELELPRYMTDQYPSGGGGLVSTCFYCWLGIPGVLLLGYFIAKRLNGLFRIENKYSFFYALLLFLSTPRWFVYYPIHIFKFSVIGVAVFWLFNNFFVKVNKKVNLLVEKN